MRLLFPDILEPMDICDCPRTNRPPNLFIRKAQKFNRDSTKYGQPVLGGRNCPLSAMGVKGAQTVPFFLRINIFSQYGEVMNSINSRDANMHH